MCLNCGLGIGLFQQQPVELAVASGADGAPCHSKGACRCRPLGCCGGQRARVSPGNPRKQHWFRRSGLQATSEHMKIRLVLVAVVAAALLAMSSAVVPSAARADGWHDGLAAYDRGDYATALRLWRPYAARGDMEAQYNLGGLYDQGLGMPQDHAEALKWYRLAAGQGDAALPAGNAGSGSGPGQRRGPTPIRAAQRRLSPSHLFRLPLAFRHCL